MLENTILIILVSSSIPYLIGSIPFGLIFSKLNGYGDIRKIGSGNIGATNVLRTGNKKLALLVLICDGFKGYLSVILVTIFLSNNYSEISLCIAIIFVIIGHCFPIWLKFKGGKGVATILGCLLALSLFLGTIILISWLLISLISKSVSKDFGTEEEATNMLERAVNLINYNKIYALNIFTERTGGFNFKDLYPFCADDSGILTGHPFNVGFDLLTF